MYAKEEKQVIIDVLNGNADAYAVLINRYQRPIFNMLLRMVASREDAADLVQDTFVKAYENLERFRLSARFFPWLYTIGMNLARDHLRRRKTAAVASCHFQAGCFWGGDAGHDPEQDMARCLDAGRMPALLAGLPEDYREALVLRFHQGLGMRDIGAALGITTSGAKMRIVRGLQKLRAMFKDRATAVESENQGQKDRNDGRRRK